MLSDGETIEEAAEIAKIVYDILKQRCFELRKFYSNHDEVLQYFNTDDCQKNKILNFGKNENTKTLGLIWSPKNDCLMYNVPSKAFNQKITKWYILSSISQIYDPLGLLSPCIINVKILLQHLWLEKLSWGESLPLHTHDFWCKFKKELPILNDLKLNRFVLSENNKLVELHAFEDACEKPYGASIY